jgi:hypothetical protein
VLTQPLTFEPEQAKYQFSILAVLTQRLSSVQYREHIHNGNLVYAQDLVDEHASKRERKATELCLDGLVGSSQACTEAVCNLLCLYSYAIPKFTESIFWQQLADFLEVISSSQASMFFRYHGTEKQVFLHLFLVVQSILLAFHEVATSPVNRKAVRDGTPLTTSVFHNALETARTQMQYLYGDISSQTLNFTKTIPAVARLFPTLRLTDKLLVKPAPVAVAEPNPKRFKSDAPPSAATKNNPPEGNQQQAPKTSQAEIDANKREGFLIYNKAGNVPALTLYYTDKTGAYNRLCFHGITRGSFCRWGKRCTFHHPSKLGDIPEEQRRTLIKHVELTDGLQFVSGQAPPGTK